MPDVWQSVLDSAAAMHVTVQVIPTGTPMSVLPTTGFTAFTFHAGRPPLVIVETVAAEVSFAGERETADVETVWQHLTEAALTPEDSQGFVRELAAAGL